MSAGVGPAGLPARPLRFLCLNSNGLRGCAKRHQLFHELSEGPWDVIALQEAHAASADEVESWVREGAGRGLPFRGHCFTNPHTSTSAGTVTLIKSTAPVDTPAQAAAPAGGRLLSVQFSYAGLPFSVLNVYTPCESSSRPAFFSEDLPGVVPAEGLVLAGGDWNMVCGAEDCFGAGAGTHRFVGSRELEGVLQQHGMMDAWRCLHPDERCFTYCARTAAGSTAARLDRWYVSAALLPWVASAGVVCGLPGDHYGVELLLVPPSTAAAGLPSGPGRFRLPLHYLSDPAFLASASQCIRQYLQANPALPGGAGQRWASLTAELSHHCRVATAARRRHEAAARRSLVAKLRTAQRAFCNRPESPEVQAAYWQAWQRLRDHEAAAAALRAQQAGVLWHAFGEQPTKWFYRCARPAESPHLLPAVLDPTDPAAPPADMASPEGRALAKQRAVAFFSAESEVGLFRPAPHDAAAQHRLLDALDARLSAEEAAATLGPGDGLITSDEVVRMFSLLPSGVAPGLDGLPYELYRALWEELGPAFLAMANEALLAAEAAGDEVMEAGEQAVLPPSSLAGLIVLLRKSNRTDARDLGNLRPITLLNCDYRILARVIASRMAHPLLSVIDTTQTAFLPGRDIADNILYHMEACDWLQESGQQACVLHLDFVRAYDRMLRPWIFQVMRAMGFPRRAVLWVQLLLAGTTAQVSLNGHYTVPFPVRRSVQQGSPLSVILYTITAQPLAAALRRATAQGLFHTYQLPDGSAAPPSHQHADDTSVHARTTRDAAAAVSGPVQDFCLATNAEVHLGKTKGRLFGEQEETLGPDRVCTACSAYFPPPQEPIRHLGVHLAVDTAAAQVETWNARRARVAEGAAHWGAVGLSWLGRCHVSKQVLAAMLVHHATFQPPPRQVWEGIQRAIFAFMSGATLVDAQGRSCITHPARHVAALPWQQGGVAMIDPALHAECLQGKVAARLLSPGRHPWKVLASARLFRGPEGAAPEPPDSQVTPCSNSQPARAARRAELRRRSAVRLSVLGPVAPLSGLQVGRLPHLDARRQAYLSGLQRLLPHRLVPPEHLSTNQVLIERLYFNRQVRGPDGEMLDPEAAVWQPLVAAGLHTVRQLRDAWVQRPTLALQIAWHCLPPAWRQAALQPPLSPWELCRTHGREWVRRQDEGGPASYYSVRGDAVLSRLAAPPVLPAAAVWEQCCVVEGPVGGGRVRQSCFFLQGPWSEVLVDPSTWGFGQTTLVGYTVRSATLRRVQLRAAREEPNFYRVGVGCRPALWALPAGVPGPSSATTGLQAMELRWAASHDAVLRAPPGRRRPTREWEVEVLPCQQPGKRPRLSVHQRVERRQEEEAERRQQGMRLGAPPAPAAAAALHVPLQDDTVDATAPPGAPEQEEAEWRAARAAWVRIRRAGLPREQHGLAYRILHGSLYVNSFLCHIGLLPAHAAYCECADCQPEGVLESLSHAFLRCPAVAPAAAWVCSVFAAVSGGAAPPCCPRVLLGDEHAVWRPEPSLQHCWTHLRVSFLHSVWQLRARRSRAGRPFCPATVCAATVAAVRAAIQRDWLRASADLRRLPGTYSEWFRGRNVNISMERFKRRWARGGCLCSVEAGAGGAARLVLRFSVALPVAAPPAAPDAPAAMLEVDDL